MKISVRGTFIDIDLRAAPAGVAISPGEPDRWDLLVLEIPTIDRTLVLRRPAKGEITCDVLAIDAAHASAPAVPPGEPENNGAVFTNCLFLPPAGG